MKSINAKWDYDLNDDILYFTKLKKTYNSSIKQDDFIFDLDNESKICGIEILNASKHFNLNKINLKNISELKLNIIIDEKSIQLKFDIEINIRNSIQTSILAVEKINENHLKPMEKNMFALA